MAISLFLAIDSGEAKNSILFGLARRLVPVQSLLLRTRSVRGWINSRRHGLVRRHRKRFLEATCSSLGASFLSLEAGWFGAAAGEYVENMVVFLFLTVQLW